MDFGPMGSTNVNKKGSSFYNYFQLRPLDLLHKWLNIYNYFQLRPLDLLHKWLNIL